jgi:hypothetical protein
MDESPAPPMKPLVGRVVRTLTQTAQLARETFWLEGPRQPYEAFADWAADDVIAERDFSGPLAGPILLWDEPIGRVSQLDELLTEYFAGNLSVVKPAIDPVEFDARGLEPLSDEEFWEPIDAMRGSQSEKAINKAGRMVSAKGGDFVLRWRETAALKAMSLVESFRRHGLGEFVADDLGMGLIGSVLARGQIAFAQILIEPAQWDPRWPTDHSSSLLFLGQLSSERSGGAFARIVTSFSDEQKRMLAERQRRIATFQESLHGDGRLGRSEVEALLGDAPDIFKIHELIGQERQFTLEGHKAIRDAMIHPPGYWKQARDIPESTTYFASRGLVEVNGLIHLRLVYVAVPRSDVGARPAQKAMESFGGRVCPPLDVSDRRSGSAHSSAVFEIKRRFRGTRDDYLARFVSPRFENN